jgi:hypothetical protein
MTCAMARLRNLRSGRNGLTPWQFGQLLRSNCAADYDFIAVDVTPPADRTSVAERTLPAAPPSQRSAESRAAERSRARLITVISHRITVSGLALDIGDGHRMLPIATHTTNMRLTPPCYKPFRRFTEPGVHAQRSWTSSGSSGWPRQADAAWATVWPRVATPRRSTASSHSGQRCGRGPSCATVCPSGRRSERGLNLPHQSEASTLGHSPKSRPAKDSSLWHHSGAEAVFSAVFSSQGSPGSRLGLTGNSGELNTLLPAERLDHAVVYQAPIGAAEASRGPGSPCRYRDSGPGSAGPACSSRRTRWPTTRRTRHLLPLERRRSSTLKAHFDLIEVDASPLADCGSVAVYPSTAPM